MSSLGTRSDEAPTSEVGSGRLVHRGFRLPGCGRRSDVDAISSALPVHLKLLKSVRSMIDDLGVVAASTRRKGCLRRGCNRFLWLLISPTFVQGGRGVANQFCTGRTAAAQLLDGNRNRHGRLRTGSEPVLMSTAQPTFSSNADYSLRQPAGGCN